MTNIPSVTIPVEQSTIEALDAAIRAVDTLTPSQAQRPGAWTHLQELRALYLSLLVAQRRSTLRPSPVACTTCED